MIGCFVGAALLAWAGGIAVATIAAQRAPERSQLDTKLEGVTQPEHAEQPTEPVTPAKTPVAKPAEGPCWPVYGRTAARTSDGADLSDMALELARENEQRLHVGNVRFVQSDLFANLRGEHYDLIVSNPPYVTNAETDALPREYSYEPELGLRAGDDGLDIVLRILRDAPLHLTDEGLLVCEVGEAEQALVRLLPELPLMWVEFKVGQMGVFVAERHDLVAHNARIRQLADLRGSVAAKTAHADEESSASLF